MTMLNNSGVHCPAFLHEIKDITTSYSINKRKSASLNIGATNRSLWSEFELNVLLNFCNPTGPIFTWKSKKPKKMFTCSSSSINSSKEYVFICDLL